jgi:hypothetical protein
MTDLPDDMEAVVSARLVEVDAHGGTTPFRNAYFRVDVIRALLLAYQERGRALATCRGSAAPLLEQSEDHVWRRAKLIVDTVDATLNLKGDER